MHFVYLDESGDPGLTNSPTAHYILAGFSVHYSNWHHFDQKLRDFRSKVEACHGFPAQREFHASEFLGAARTHGGLDRATRLIVARSLLTLLEESPELRFFGWIAHKQSPCPMERASIGCFNDLAAWAQAGHFHHNPRLLIIHDLMGRRPQAWEQSNDLLLGTPLALGSHESLQIQVADFIAYLLKQKLTPNSFMRAQGCGQLIKRLSEHSLGWNEV